jgi:hypothetical protein
MRGVCYVNEYRYTVGELDGPVRESRRRPCAVWYVRYHNIIMYSVCMTYACEIPVALKNDNDKVYPSSVLLIVQ